ncbi:hypothetical protein ACFOU2_21940 [Bacillus songklensis]|uniref:Lipoprotein n=1 Tax=Bacillus songklensis TaxID=1069116 RepID=A0ABV8B6W2_9BACI
MVQEIRNNKKEENTINKVSSLVLGSLLILGLAGCTNSPDSPKSSNSAAATSATQKEINATPTMFEQKEVKNIEVTSVKTKITRAFTKENDMKMFTASMEHAKKMKLLLDEESADNIDCKMKISYQDGSNHNYFIWIMDEGKDVVIGYQKKPDDVHLEGYELTEDRSKQLAHLLEEIL